MAPSYPALHFWLVEEKSRHVACRVQVASYFAVVKKAWDRQGLANSPLGMVGRGRGYAHAKTMTSEDW